MSETPTDAGPSTSPSEPPRERVSVPARALPGYLQRRYAAWRDGPFVESESWYRRLAEVGQRPRAMLVSCCDSRVNAEQLFGAEPGELFVVRNVAALVPPHEPDQRHHGTSAAVEYAVMGLGVAHIVVVGHSSCGGVAACHAMCAGEAPELDAPGSYIGRWTDLLRPGWERVRAEGRSGDPRALEQEAVITSLANLMSFPFVAEAVEREALTLHGAWIDIASGRLEVLDGRRGVFA
ncbi:MAG: carbonic anhydrase [Paracoccaceae bacterium]